MKETQGNQYRHFKICGEWFSSAYFPNLAQMEATSSNNAENQLKSIANAWHDGDISSAAIAFESDLQHDGGLQPHILTKEERRINNLQLRFIEDQEMENGDNDKLPQGTWVCPRIPKTRKEKFLSWLRRHLP